MLRSIKQLYGDELKAKDGEIGHIKDFYFDDQNWAVRYVVVDTGSWLQRPSPANKADHTTALEPNFL